jgi:hypothetical protein
MTEHKEITKVHYAGFSYDVLDEEDLHYLQKGAHEEVVKWEKEDKPGRARVMIDADVLVALCGEVIGFRVATAFIASGSPKVPDEPSSEKE